MALKANAPANAAPNLVTALVIDPDNLSLNLFPALVSPEVALVASR